MNDSHPSNEATFRLTEKHLLEAGYDPGPWLRDMIVAATAYQERGIQGKNTCSSCSPAISARRA